MRGRRLLAAAVVLAALAGCQSVAPALHSLVMAFGQDLLAAAAVNHTPRYAVEVENLLAVLARQATGMPFEGRLAQAGYQPPPPGYARDEPAGYPAGTHQPPAAAGDVYAGYQDPYATSSNPPDYEHPPYDDPSQAPAGNNGGYPYPDPYAAATVETRSGAQEAGPISLGVALLARRAGTTELVEIDDGEVLYDGRGDPGRGDLLRVHFQASCACWVYVIGIDATGFVARIFPDPEGTRTNPVTAGTSYVMPGGDQWWALDDHRGVEQIYFVASREPRPDVEAAIETLASQPRQVGGEGYRPVGEPAVVPVTRGLVKVTAPEAVTVPMDGAAPARVTPAVFTNRDTATDVVITRWFRHQ